MFVVCYGLHLSLSSKDNHIYGRLYAQLDQPPKVRFEINAVKVYGLL